MKTHSDVKLSTGRTVVHSRMPNGAQAANIAGDHPEMTIAEHREYCSIIEREKERDEMRESETWEMLGETLREMGEGNDIGPDFRIEN